MSEYELSKIQDALEIICDVTHVDYEEVVDELTGTCWDEETAGDIKFMMISP